MTRALYRLAVLPLALMLGGCVHNTYLIIQYGAGRSESDMSKVEHILQASGFIQGAGMQDKQPTERYIDQARMHSNFYLNNPLNGGLTAEVELSRSDGKLSCEIYQHFVERFDDANLQSVTAVKKKSTEAFGKDIDIRTETKTQAYFL